MALMHVRFMGKSINHQTAMHIWAPEEGKGPWPVLYLLHGHSGDYTAWPRATRIEWYLSYPKPTPLIVVMPDGSNSFYVNTDKFGAYEDHILNDVVDLVDRLLPTIPRRESRAIAGLSMGGYGAMTLGLKHPEMFSVISSHSGAFYPAARKGFDPAFRRQLEHPRKLAEALVSGRKRLAVRMDCGMEDGLLAENRRFHKHLEKIGLAHTYVEYPGGHDWDYWDLHIRETLDFVMEHVGKKRRRSGKRG